MKENKRVIIDYLSVTFPMHLYDEEETFMDKTFGIKEVFRKILKLEPF